MAPGLKGNLSDMEQPIILPSARKHGVADEDMLHAYRNTMRVFEQADGMTMIVGPARDGALLEVGLLIAHDFEGVLIAHAMNPARKKYLR